MTIDIILSQSEHKYVARVKEWPDVVVEEDTRQEALDQVSKRLINYLTHQVEVVQLDIDLPAQGRNGHNNRNPWLEQ